MVVTSRNIESDTGIVEGMQNNPAPRTRTSYDKIVGSLIPGEEIKLPTGIKEMAARAEERERAAQERAALNQDTPKINPAAVVPTEGEKGDGIQLPGIGEISKNTLIISAVVALILAVGGYFYFRNK